MKAAQDRHAKYANLRRRPLSFQQGDRVFLKISPFRGTVCFEMRGKLSPRYIGPYEILDRVGDLAYKLALPPALLDIHDVFHRYMLRKYQPDPSHALQPNEAELDETLSDRLKFLIERISSSETSRFSWLKYSGVDMVLKKQLGS
ncbi:uncharacterized protein [Henckelia pumila]|uniref:uncharacterized protein n=1 Tax=Henckelia pumila TaxID=405737 RepID=UPI003C6E5B74